MFEYFSKRLRFVRIFLSADNLDQLRAVCLEETSDAREVVDLGPVGGVVVDDDDHAETCAHRGVEFDRTHQERPVSGTHDRHAIGARDARPDAARPARNEGDFAFEIFHDSSGFWAKRIKRTNQSAY